MTDIQNSLFLMRDEEYKQFSSMLMPNVEKNTVIGVRTPLLRQYAKQLFGTNEAVQFIKLLPHKYYEENNLHGFIIEQIKNYDECICEIEHFLPYIDNWATCDFLRPKVFKKNKEKLMEKIPEWLKSDKTYTVRFGIEMLMSFYLDKDFLPNYLEFVAQVHSNEYYVNMMSAWFFATALAKQPESTLPYIEKNLLDVWVHNKTIQKAIESRRITDAQKDYLRGLKR